MIQNNLECSLCGHLEHLGQRCASRFNPVYPHLVGGSLCGCSGVAFPHWLQEETISEQEAKPEFSEATKRTPVLRYHLIDASFIVAMAQVMTEGAEIRGHSLGGDDWRLLPHTEQELLDHAEHHLLIVKSGLRKGEAISKEEKRRQLAKLAANAMMLWDTLGKEGD